MSVVNTNVSASIAQAAPKNDRALGTAMEQLSTGKRSTPLETTQRALRLAHG